MPVIYLINSCDKRVCYGRGTHDTGIEHCGERGQRNEDEF